MKRGIILVFAVFLALLSLNTAFAEIMLNQPKTVYNTGDTLEISATVKATQQLNDFIELSLKCGESSKLFYLSPLSLETGQEEKVDKKLVLSKSFLQDLGGNCYVKARDGSSSYTSQVFKISDKIYVSVNIDKDNVNPNEKVSIKGSAVKENGENVNGFAELSIKGTDIKTVSTVSSGNVEFNFSFAYNTKSGSYSVNILVYEKIKNEITSSGMQDIYINLKQEPRKIDISVDKQSVVPGSSLKFKPVVYDQAGDEISGDVGVEVVDSSGSSYLSRLMPLSETQEIVFPENTSYGSWKIKLTVFGLKSTRDFSIEQLEKAKFEVSNNTLSVTNIGNVPYNRAIQVAIGSDVRVIEMNLDLGESKVFELTGDGTYDVKVSDGQEEVSVSGMNLIGGVIGVEELRSNLNMFNRYPVMWLFLILVGGMFVFTLSRRVINKRYYGYAPKQESKGFEKIETRKASDIQPITLSRNVSGAENSLVLQGRKEEASVISLKIKNQLIGNASQSVERAISSVNENKGALQKTSDGYSAIFVPSVTKTFKNDLIAVKVASEIASCLNEHNKKFKDKIEYGVGIHSGELVVKIENGKLKFTSLGNAVNMAKRIADSADKTVLISGETNKKVSNDVKTLRQGDFYSISRIIEREQHKQFLDKFMDRNKFR